ncbi:MAG: hypothetical protein ABI779_02865 [Acidobacteriota bacterium]
MIFGPRFRSVVNPAAVEAEIRDLVRFRDLASSITENAKGTALLQALAAGFETLRELGANEKAIIFTESRRTQQYLIDLLEGSGYAGEVMTFNGTNTDPASAQIYKSWKGPSRRDTHRERAKRRRHARRQSCRTPAEIDAAFNRLQEEMSSAIENRMTTTRPRSWRNFDEEVHQRLRVTQDRTDERLGRLERWLWSLTKHELGTNARYDDDRHRFFVPNRVPGCPEAPTGTYRLHMREQAEDGHRPYRLGDPLAEGPELASPCRDRRHDPCSRCRAADSRCAGRCSRRLQR